MTGSTHTKHSYWADDLGEVCAQFQLDLSCMVDRELDEVAAVRAIAHMEDCDACTSFFDDVRAQVRAHRDLVLGEDLIETLVGAPGLESIELQHRLSQIFYHLGKAYVLTALDPGWATRVFERPVEVAAAQARGRGYVDGVVARGGMRQHGIDLQHARHMLNGRLSRIESPLEKGRRLLDEALAIDPSHEEARLYLAYLCEREGKTLRAANAYRQVFRTSVQDVNRGHAALRLGNLLAKQGEYKKAIACSRWVLSAGLEALDERFFVARFNVGKNYAKLGERERALDAFRGLFDHHRERRDEIVRAFLTAPSLQQAIDAQPGFGEALLERCPELLDDPESTEAENGNSQDTSGQEQTENES